jgi:thymidine kinase
MQVGRVETIVGGMFAGKTEELIRRLRRATFAGKKVLAFKPAMDNRYSATDLASHAGVLFPSIPVRSADDILGHVGQYEQVDVVGVDEVQFFDPRVCAVAELLAGRGVRVVLAGLDLDYLGEPFGPVPRLLAVSDTVTKVTAVCMKCGADATRSQRLVVSPEQVLVGAQDTYEARCRGCWTPHHG